jgi:hypothetical protein
VVKEEEGTSPVLLSCNAVLKDYYYMGGTVCDRHSKMDEAIGFDDRRKKEGE